MDLLDLEARFEVLIANKDWDKAANIKRCLVLNLNPEPFDMADQPGDSAGKAQWVEYAELAGHDVTNLTKPEIQELFE
jgi:hypothetical protein